MHSAEPVSMMPSLWFSAAFSCHCLEFRLFLKPGGKKILCSLRLGNDPLSWPGAFTYASNLHHLVSLFTFVVQPLNPKVSF